ncbi:MAG: hypothetical protein WCR47_10190 [Desulfoplanes sp.]
MKVAVIAGTRFDTARGCSMLEHSGILCYPIPIADTPKEQNQRQYADAGGLQTKIKSIAIIT